MIQIDQLHTRFDDLQQKYGDPTLSSIYGAGMIHNPKLMFIFMNPTGRNISAYSNWDGIRAPWLGTKQVWSIFKDLHLLDNYLYEKIIQFRSSDWDTAFAKGIYKDLEKRSVYVTNLAKCTQIDARPLPNITFKEYLPLMYEEIEIIKPKNIITFGNQVSSVLLNKQISVSKYLDTQKENLILGSTYDVYPTYYPVGQGRRNMSLAIERIERLISSLVGC